MSDKLIDRRGFLRLTGLGAGALAVSQFSRLAGAAQPAVAPTPMPGMGDTMATPTAMAGMAKPSSSIAPLELEMRAVQSQAPILPGAPTRVWTYQAKVLSGDSSQLVTLPDNYLGPIIRVAHGQHLKVNFYNDLPEDTTVHMHGLIIPSNMSGHPHPSDVVHPGGKFLYEFDILNPAGLYLFHPHPHMRLGYQLYHGLAGLVVVTDNDEAALGLPDGTQDAPVVIQDRVFDANNQLVYNAGGMGMSMMYGWLGNRILVNGKPDYVLTVPAGPCRLRVLNASNARVYKLAWQNGMPFTVFAADGLYLQAPVQKNYLMLGSGQRVDLWVDFTGQTNGSELVLQGLPFSDGMMGGMMGGMGGMGGTNSMSGMGMGSMGGTDSMGGMGRMGRMSGTGTMGGTNSMGGMGMGGGMYSSSSFPILRVRIDGKGRPAALPKSLPGPKPFRAQDAVNLSNPRTFYLQMAHMNWYINGRTFEMEAVADDEKIPLDTLEMWQFVNTSPIAHPMHIHNVSFNVVERTMTPGWSSGYATVNQGFVDQGWNDTVLVMPGETVKVLVKFTTYSGMFMYHCHIVEHEDMGMMRNLMVGTAGAQPMQMSP